MLLQDYLDNRVVACKLSKMLVLENRLLFYPPFFAPSLSGPEYTMLYLNELHAQTHDVLITYKENISNEIQKYKIIEKC